MMLLFNYFNMLYIFRPAKVELNISKGITATPGKWYDVIKFKVLFRSTFYTFPFVPLPNENFNALRYRHTGQIQFASAPLRASRMTS